MAEAQDEISEEIWAEEDAKRAQMWANARLMASWSAGWLLRQTVKGAAMALGAWLVLSLIGVIPHG